jgi:hypothetical protein
MGRQRGQKKAGPIPILVTKSFEDLRVLKAPLRARAEKEREIKDPLPKIVVESVASSPESRADSRVDNFSPLISQISDILANALGGILGGIFKPRGAGFYWHACGERHGLLFNSAPPGPQRYYELQGSYRGALVQMETGRSKKGEDSLLQVFFPQPLDEGLRIYPETESTRQIPSHLREDIVIGDKPFDDAFVIKGGMESSVRRRLNPIVRERLLRLWRILEPGDQFEVFDNRIVYQFPSFIENPEQLFPLIDAMVDVVNVITENKRQLFIKFVGHNERCEICHKDDEFDPERSYCRRCNHVST